MAGRKGRRIFDRRGLRSSTDYLGAAEGGGVRAASFDRHGRRTRKPLSELLAKLTGRAGMGIEIVSKVKRYSKGSRLAVSQSVDLPDRGLHARHGPDRLAGPVVGGGR